MYFDLPPMKNYETIETMDIFSQTFALISSMSRIADIFPFIQWWKNHKHLPEQPISTGMIMNQGSRRGLHLFAQTVHQSDAKLPAHIRLAERFEQTQVGHQEYQNLRINQHFNNMFNVIKMIVLLQPDMYMKY